MLFVVSDITSERTTKAPPLAVFRSPFGYIGTVISLLRFCLSFATGCFMPRKNVMNFWAKFASGLQRKRLGFIPNASSSFFVPVRCNKGLHALEIGLFSRLSNAYNARIRFSEWFWLVLPRVLFIKNAIKGAQTAFFSTASLGTPSTSRGITTDSLDCKSLWLNMCRFRRASPSSPSSMYSKMHLHREKAAHIC